jgi:DNA-directed RNA polymerase subunit RPC12/RpoP
MNPPGLRNMPIRFRCVYCDQKLGIGTRKAGTVVKCPNCTGQIIVPPPDQQIDDSHKGPTASATAKDPAALARKTATAPMPGGSNEAGLLFERSDFDELLKPAVESAAPQAPAARMRSKTADAEMMVEIEEDPPANAHVPPPDIVPPPQPAKQGILLTPVRATILCVVGVLAIAFAFGGGILLGMMLTKS